MTNHEILRLMKRSARTLYDRYTRSENDRWLEDNYYIFEREGKALFSFLKNAPKKDAELIAKLFSIVKESCESCVLPNEMTIGRLFCDKNLSVAGYEYAYDVFKCALILSCAESNDENAVEKTVKSLGRLEDVDFEKICSEYSEAEKLLNEDETYRKMPRESKAVYRKQVFYLSQKQGVSEAEIIKKAFENGGHIGFLLFPKVKNKNGKYAVFEFVFVFCISVALAVFSGSLTLFFILLLPVWQIVDTLILPVQMKKNPPRPLLRVEGETDAKTLVTMCTLLPSAAACNKVEKHLTELYAANRDENIYFCLLADKKGFSSPEKPDDSANTEAAVRMIKRLNKKFGDRFILLVRGREYSKTGREYIGKNRKMGAVESLVNLLCEKEDESFETVEGNRILLENVKYILVLDSDTSLPFSACQRLVSVAEHPLNKAEIDGKTGIVESGYAVFAPKIQTRILDESDTLFSSLMSGSGGVTAYDNLSCDRYQDVFGAGAFSGKGLIDVKAYHELICGRFRDEKILSHDIIEGEFLRTLFVSDTEVEDSFPKSEGAYLSRLHRWVRGDWQNLPFLFLHPSMLSKKEANPLPFNSRYKLFENLRRSLCPVMSLISILVSVFCERDTGILLISAGLLSVCAGEIISFIKALLRGGFNMMSRLYYGAALPDALFCLAKGVINIVMLPTTAYKCFSAIVTALFRQFVTKKKMLEWVPAADSERDVSFGSVLIHNLFSVLCSVFLLIFGSPYSYLCAILFLLNIAFEYLSKRKIRKPESRLDILTRERMLSHAAAQWKYYEKYCGEEDGFLPPDNVQFSPVFRIAHRTSPTNIGLMLVCTLTARDFGFIDNDRLFERLSRAVDSIEKLKKWHGNLLNWYDTATLEALEPKYVSTVDSGNFLCSLVALKEGLKEYSSQKTELNNLIERIEKIIAETDLTPLFNKKRQLFHIGFDMSTNALSDSFYDILMSEARLTSYFAVCTKAVPKKHWGALSRSLGRKARYSGPLSWSGTFFEYFMPNIFLPSRENTFCHEGLRFCLYCQSLYAKRRRIPWGVSESAFFSFDNECNYQYKAHGVGSLALCRTAENDTVVSPYSSYLALPFAPKKAAANIKRLERLHLLGEFGLYEAADFTKGRMQSPNCAPVKSFMAHHVGMSLLSIHNALEGFRIQNLFMSDIDMAAGESLLDEKIPTGAPVFKKLYETNQKQKDVRRERFVKKNDESTRPSAFAYSNDEITVCVGADGVTKDTFRDKCIFRFDRERILKPSGVTAIFKTDGGVFPFSPYLKRSEADKYACNYTKNFAEITRTGNGLKLSEKIYVHGFLPCEKRVFTIQNASKKAVSGEVLIYFEPSLDTFKNEKSHPAFSHLFVTDSFDKKTKTLSFTRRGRTDNGALCLSCRFENDVDFDYTCNRERVLERPDGIFSLMKSRDFDFEKKTGTPDCCGLFSVRIKLKPKEKISLPLLFAVGKNEIKNRETLTRVINSEGLQKSEATAVFEPYGECGMLLKRILPFLIYNIGTGIEKDSNIGNINTLWSLGISGDRPIILCLVYDASDVAGLESIIKIHISLNRFFINNDLVIAFSEDGTYSSPIRHAIQRRTEKTDKNSLFTINLFGRDSVIINTLKAYSTVFFDGNNLPEISDKSPLPVEIKTGEKTGTENGVIDDGYRIGNSPVLPWCFVYSNKYFGTLVSDKSLGFTYAFNSFLNRLTGWANDTRTDFDDEKLIAKIDGKYFDIIKNCDVSFHVDKAEYYCNCDGIEFKTTVTVPYDKFEKQISVKVKSDKSKTVELCFCAVPLLSSDERDRRFIYPEKTKNGIVAENPMNLDFKGKMYVVSDKTPDFFVFDLFDFLSGKWDDKPIKSTVHPAIATGKKIALNKNEEYEITFSIGFECNVVSDYCRVENGIEIYTPDSQLDSLFNVFLPVQTVRGRLQARTGFYQCSGAYGFRDQLQDALALEITCPEMLKEQILLCASAQFKEGDVLHWFHLTDGGVFKGVRTKYSDDRLWLVLAVCRYVEATGDRSILQVFVPFLEGKDLEKNETERYFSAVSSSDGATVFEHCICAIEKSLHFGRNGLPLIFGGDWNDGFNAVGIKGKGESVWLGEFLAIVLCEFSDFCEDEMKKRYLTIADELKKNIDKNAWRGDRYARAFYDDGISLGDERNVECRLDSLSQSFAVFCGMPDNERKRQALESAKNCLIDYENGLVKLFDGGFEKDRRAGYIASYPVGLRENGGQYTHAAVWLAMAFFKNGDANTGYEILKLLNPLSKYESGLGEKYLTEPYFLAGDVYSKKGVEGRGGWSIYTGSSGWYYKAVYECIFGLKKKGDRFFFSPSFPEKWEKTTLTLRLDGVSYVIKYEKSDTNLLTVDGRKAEFFVPDGREHKIIVYFSGK